MKTILLTIIMLASLNVLAQQPPTNTIYVFEYDKKIDEIVYEKNTDTAIVTGFEILLSKKKVYFHSYPIEKNIRLKVNTTRNKLEKIVKNDNAYKYPNYYIYVKEEGIFYPVDHIIVRAIYCDFN